MTTKRAPLWRATWAAMIPIGPAPVISTSSATNRNWVAVWTALPNGSKIDATSRSILVRCGHRLPAGMTMNSAKAPSRWTPMPTVFAHRARRPAMQLRQRPQTMWPSAPTISPGNTEATPSPSSTTSPTNSWPTTSGGLMVCWAHSFQLSMCRSVPQIPVRRTRSNTSPGPGLGSATSWSQRPGSLFALTSAFTGRHSTFAVRRLLFVHDEARQVAPAHDCHHPGDRVREAVQDEAPLCRAPSHVDDGVDPAHVGELDLPHVDMQVTVWLRRPGRRFA